MEIKKYKDIIDLDNLHNTFDLISGGITVDENFTITSESYDSIRNRIIESLIKEYKKADNPKKGLTGYKKYIEVKKYNEEYSSQNFMVIIPYILTLIITLIVMFDDDSPVAKVLLIIELIILVVATLIKALSYNKKVANKVFVYNEIIEIINDLIDNGFPPSEEEST